MASSGDEQERGRPLSRSDLLKRAGVLGAAATLPVAATVEDAGAAEEVAQLRQLQALSPTQARTIGAFVERLIPSDASGPGAREANVIRYIDRSLAGGLRVFGPSYVAATLALDAYSQSKHGADFAALTTTQQDAILTDMDLSRVPASAGFQPNAKAVFEMIRTHAVQGMFADPAHGGNTDFVGWKLVRFPGPRLSIPASDQRLNVVPKSNMQSTYSMPLFRGTWRRW